MNPTEAFESSASASTAGGNRDADSPSPTVIDIAYLARLYDRQNIAQEVALRMMGFSLIVFVLWSGWITVLILVVSVLLSLLMLRRVRWAAWGLIGSCLVLIGAAIITLAYAAFFEDHSLFSDTLKEFFYGVTTIGLVAGWFLVRGLHATIALAQELPLQGFDTVRSFKRWRWALGRFATSWKAWAMLFLLIVAGALVFWPWIDHIVSGRQHFLWTLLMYFLVDLPDWLSRTVYIIVILGLVGLSISAWNRLRQYLAESAIEAQRRDGRPPLLVLRSFADDALTVWPSQGLHLSRTGNTLEHTIEKELRKVGPVIAIGRPGESVPPLGAAREYLAGEVWRDHVREFIEQAQLIVVVLGGSEGLVFEYDLLAAHEAIDKLLLVIPPDVPPDLLETRWKRFAEHALGTKHAQPPDLQSAIIAFFPKGESPVYVLHPKRRPRAAHYALALQVALHRRSC